MKRNILCMNPGQTEKREHHLGMQAQWGQDFWWSEENLLRARVSDVTWLDNFNTSLWVDCGLMMMVLCIIHNPPGQSIGAFTDGQNSLLYGDITHRCPHGVQVRRATAHVHIVHMSACKPLLVDRSVGYSNAHLTHITAPNISYFNLLYS